MPSSKNQGTQVSGDSSSKQNHYQHSMLQEFLRAEPTVAERLSRLVPPKEGGENEKGHDDKAKEAIRKFEDAWRNASK
ncbi:hypothetical protein F4813DRAFT_375951 [Daldinia decipiens]|uniref:uncharacterized protein n=1 Tax=Daldinia decipiens TaxID=326647 RepID=UPI0020C2BAD2|nr:uncharacterized protein F4813DRAFT_375951 [Daldinia decipiens]KAI1653138.1 hypothetical protein F4813DRAFT_375951 [Daldinia decipiens]